MTETISTKDLFIQVPDTQDDPSWDEIIRKTLLYAPPETVEGMEFYSREVLPVSKPIRKSGEDNSNLNLTRATNPERDNLNTIETRGLNVTCYPPKTIITNPEADEDDYDENNDTASWGPVLIMMTSMTTTKTTTTTTMMTMTMTTMTPITMTTTY